MAKTPAPQGAPDCELVGLMEIADLCQVEHRTATVWRQRGRLPEPFRIVSGTPIWLKPDIEDWARATNRWPE